MPQTKTQIMRLLARHNLRPDRRADQHFLIDLNLMRILVEAAGIQPDDVVIEVGAGTGSLTEQLALRAGWVIAVERDPRLGELLGEVLAPQENLEIIVTDALANKSAVQPQILDSAARAKRRLGGRLLMVGNLPYGIASPLLADLALGQPRPEQMCFTVQRELAERLIAKPGSKTYGQLTVLMQATGQLELLRPVPATAFWPVPRVDSAMVRWRSRPSPPAPDELRALRGIVRELFAHRRKKIGTILRHGRRQLLAEIEQIGIDPDDRAENVSVEQFLRLARLAAKERDR